MLRRIASAYLLVLALPMTSIAQVGYAPPSPDVPAPPAAQTPPLPYESAWPPRQLPNDPVAYPTTSQPSPALQPPASASPWPPPGGTAKDKGPLGEDSIPAVGESVPIQQSAPVFMPSGSIVTGDSTCLSTWYFRQDSFWWNERLDGTDFVNEYGPLSTLGYQRRSGIERFRVELFGGTVSYDGAAQYEDGSLEPYHLSNGTNYLGMRGEYDLLLEPAGWSRIRGVLGVGTRFWVRDLHDAITPTGNAVFGYQETWWTFYPYFGLETRDSTEPGWKFFGSARFGITPLTYQHATYFDTTLYPRCGLTGQAELGIRFEKCSVSAFIEAMTWGESAEVRGSLQPDSQMVTVGGKLGYTF